VRQLSAATDHYLDEGIATERGRSVVRQHHAGNYVDDVEDASPVTRLTLLEAVQSLVHSTLTEMNSSSEPAYSNKTAHTGVRELSPIHKLQFSSLEF